ncbi:MAG: FIST N-terminal domain-containing protein [Bacteroidota bacterium]
MWTTSFHCQSIDQLKTTLRNSTTHQSPSIGIVFCSPNYDIDEIRTAFNELGIDLVGCTTAGEIVDTALYENSIAILLLDLDPAYYHIGTKQHQGADVYQAALTLGQEAATEFENPAMIIFSGGLVVNAELIIDGLQTGAGKSLPMYGGLAGDDLALDKTIAFSHGDVSDNCLVILSIDTDKVLLKGLAISGWEPIGGVNTITECEGNVIYGINGEPAFDVFSRYFGFSSSGDKVDQLVTIQTNYPLQILRKEGYSVLRSPLLVNEDDRSITLAASVEKGEQFRFSTSPGFEVIEKTIDEFSQLQQGVPQADALVLFSCKGRHGAFGPMLEDEISGIFEQWEKPMIGLLTYGEFGDNGKGKCEFHNETCSLVILKEK